MRCLDDTQGPSLSLSHLSPWQDSVHHGRRAAHELRCDWVLLSISPLSPAGICHSMLAQAVRIDAVGVRQHVGTKMEFIDTIKQLRLTDPNVTLGVPCDVSVKVLEH